ncbi:hypothetical protein ASPZODRAFT_653150 [Penicilliopsis zonata CBS 506.65]|uniref:Uncharacterized protein n=1 Tax=Penicilliopsis zonata CBS 506.65 TaxID=1073090 RepID=A0A1L9SCS2_9EURO|nr:hypothetical protein ASPZODRAFT_653150 [Penicilliopsis zonata CBS 506.65]OJJ44932.1 hypothetical protein ASPZODRAFT_653150 [Penicilliopsis zonata CBS 506.65]
MSLSEYASQLNFLKDSATFLSSLSPSTSAHLLTVHNRILHEELKPLNHRHHENACGACGSIRKPTVTKTCHIEKKKKKKTARSDRSTPHAFADGATIIKCLRCRRRTVRPLRKETAPSEKASRIPTPVTDTASTTPTVTAADRPVAADTTKVVKAAENANSKKRAKARKQGGLQALLASKQRSQATSSSSLDLLDFLHQ